jgi:hypothetical protein
MGSSLTARESFSISHDIVVAGKVVFRQGETVIIESIIPNPQRPDYQYVVTSVAVGQRYQLRAEDFILIGQTAEAAPAQAACASCGSSFNEPFKFCPRCGALSQEKAAALSVPAASPKPTLNTEGFPTRAAMPASQKTAPGGATPNRQIGRPVPPAASQKTSRKGLGIGIAVVVVIIIIIGVAASRSSKSNNATPATTAQEATTTTETSSTRTVDDFISIDNVHDGQELTVGPSLISGTSKDQSCTIMCNGQQVGVVPANGNFCPTVNINEGENVITFNVTDKEGKSYEKKVTLTGVLSADTYKAVSPPLPAYAELKKNADGYTGRRCKCYGQVAQAMVDGDTTTLRVNVTNEGYGIWDDTVYVTFKGSTPAVENSMVWVYGTISGSKTYESQAGWNITIPGIDAKFVDVSG